MTSTVEKGLRDILFVPKRSGMIVQTPSSLYGEPGRAIYAAYEEAKQRFGKNAHFKLIMQDGEVVGVNVPDVNLIDQIVRPFGVRASLPKDWNEEFMQMIDNRHCTVGNALGWRSLQDSYNANNNRIAKVLAERGNIDIERAGKEPAMITGFDIIPDKESKYGLVAVPTKEFAVHYDDRLLAKYNSWRFNDIDEHGLPVKLDKNQGRRIWCTREDGISGFDLYGNRLLSSNGGGLSDSGANGRVVLVAAEGGAPNFEKVSDKHLREC